MTADGLTVNSLTSSVVSGNPFPLSGSGAGPLKFSYYPLGDNLTLSGGLGSVSELGKNLRITF